MANETVFGKRQKRVLISGGKKVGAERRKEEVDK